jgi:hypothetical protein
MGNSNSNVLNKSSKTMKKLLFSLSLLLSVSLAFTSCKKEEEQSPTPDTPAPTPTLNAARLLHLPFSNNLTDASATNATSTTAQGTFVTDASSTANNAYYLAGGNKLTYNLATYPAFKVGETSDFSISIKVKFDTTYLYNQYLGMPNKTKYATFFEIGEGVFLRYLCANDPRNKQIEFGVRKAGGTYFYTYINIQSTTTTSLNGWNHAGWNTITVNYRRAPADMSFYFNGAFVGRNTEVGFANANIDFSGTNQTLSFGSGNTADQSWQGSIDNVYIFNRILTDQEITQIAGQ